MAAKEIILSYIEKHGQKLCAISDRIWAYAETRYEEYNSSALLRETLAEEGFEIEQGAAGMDTAFVATYGSGEPVIAFLGEFDALYGLSQEAGIAEKRPLSEGGNGHGCGHHALGVGALAASLALKNYMDEKGLKGTIKYFGCPAEEGGCGKVYLARANYFDHVDAAITWHPFTSSNIMTFNTLATASAYFKFHGISSHAAGSPHLGRSALDGVELMSVGVNFLREHVESDVRLHYAIVDTGGMSPNVVQAHAAALHQIRAPKPSQVREIYDRVVDIAKGAALMSGTRLEVVFDKASSNMLYNDVLGRLLYEKLMELGQIPVDAEDIAFARKIRESLNEQERRLDEGFAFSLFGNDVGQQIVGQIADKDIIDILYPYHPMDIVGMGSSDLGDVSWNVPSVSMQIAAYAKDTSPHSWQQVAQGTAPLLHKGMLHAGKAMALAGAELMENPGILTEAKEEFKRRRRGETYTCPIPPEVKPAPSR